MTRTYGTLEHEDDGIGARWRLVAEPHVMMRLKRIFPRVLQQRTGHITLADTPEIARDLTWVCDRWPLEMTAPVLERLTDRERLFNERTQTVESILAGYVPPLGFKDPARPARDYQTVAASIVHATGQLLLTDELGLGKSMTALLTLLDPDALPAVIVTLTHLPTQWLGELNETLPWLVGHIVTTGIVYDPSTRRGFGRNPDVFIMNYHKLFKWSDYLAGRVRTVIFDEAQELRRSGSDKYAGAARVAHPAMFRWGLTATPVYNYGPEIWNVLNVIAPDALGSRDEFNREWCAGEGGHQKVQNPAALGVYLRDQGLMLRRTRKEVKRELPEVQRIHHTITLDQSTLDALTVDATALAEALLSADLSAKERFQASGDFDWRLRHATGVAKAAYVAEFARMLLESDEPIILFGWHRDVYEIWADRLEQFKPAFFTGTESPNQKHESERRFLDGDTHLLIMSLRAGAGLDGLQKRAHVAVFGELDWSPGIHSQCVGRLHRDGQDEPVVAYFLVADDGADPAIAEVLDLKRQQSDPIQDPHGALFTETASNSDRIRLLARTFLTRRRSKAS